MNLLPIIWTEADRLAAAGCAIILWPLAVWFAVKWMLTRTQELDPEDHDGLSYSEIEEISATRNSDGRVQ
ncbi:hypothetical protein GG804_25165 [Sphingomonas histidinilytica]|uniref:hypothetical protein n=1 Tax=Rhizorhabdus histidinilytica TaxID=439228 RepID=UPI001ADC8263|nr:hypothetical protein [Rhizorhabdus histidinilytica]MBO9380063.1 hypothetical protein [Rhizorhabdus histidinilytica]